MNELNQKLRAVQKQKTLYSKQLEEIELVRQEYKEIIAELTENELEILQELNRNDV